MPFFCETCDLKLKGYTLVTPKLFYLKSILVVNIGKKVKNCVIVQTITYLTIDELMPPLAVMTSSNHMILKDIYMLQISQNYHQSYLDMTVTSILEDVWTGHPW